MAGIQQCLLRDQIRKLVGSANAVIPGNLLSLAVQQVLGVQCVCVVAVRRCVHVICHRRRLQGFYFAVPSNRSLGYGTLRVRSASK